MPVDKIALKKATESSLHSLTNSDFVVGGRRFFSMLGYQSNRWVDTPNDKLFAAYQSYPGIGDPTKDLESDLWIQSNILFQLTGGDLAGEDLFQDFDTSLEQSYLFYAVELKAGDYSKSRLSAITRNLNKLYRMPVFVLFKYGDRLTLSIIDRRQHKRDSDRDVLEKVTLIKDISTIAPHRAHLEILSDLALPVLREGTVIQDWQQLHAAWRKALNVSELNKEFYQRIANWYFWAKHQVIFPDGAGENKEVRNSTSVIRMITRIIFIWFLKERELIPETLFDQEFTDTLLNKIDPNESTYYKAILQNLFFATLNSEMNVEGKLASRKWSKGGPGSTLAARKSFFIPSYFRYKRYFTKPEEAFEIFNSIPFLNGGLFECLDKRFEPEVRVDSFSDGTKNVLKVPDYLFFEKSRIVDLSAEYDDKAKKAVKVSGLFEILRSYKFTIAENTPVEEEVALDPELLGKVFENLLASYNEETRESARKQSGSFYTPREIVDYMVEESIKQYLLTALTPNGDTEFEARVGRLVSIDHSSHEFQGRETELISALHKMRVFDPACGSGAFPMGVLNRLVHIISKLDPEHTLWRRELEAKAEAITHSDVREEAMNRIEEAFLHEPGYARKLYLIESCIYGADIQPIAVQIAKLRFFISLLVDQRIDKTRENYGIRALPNLETRFVCANTLLPLDSNAGLISTPEIYDLERKLNNVRRDHMFAKSSEQKKRLRDKDEKLREELAKKLEDLRGLGHESAKMLASWNPYETNIVAPFFDAVGMFQILDGFDIVIGNPPYVRHGKIKPAEYKARLSNTYPATGNKSNDLLVYFYELGYRVLKEGGVFTMITSNKFMRSSYGAKLREFLKRKTSLLHLIDFGDIPVFDFLSYPVIVMFRKEPPQDTRFAGLTVTLYDTIAKLPEAVSTGSTWMEQKDLDQSAWRIESGAKSQLIEKLRANSVTLDEYIGGKFYRGIVTGFNEAFVIDDETRQALIREDRNSAKVIKPFLRGRDIKRYEISDSGLFIIFTRRGINITEFPAIKRYLGHFRAKLEPGGPEGRKHGNYKWYEIQDSIDYWKEFERPKIIWGNMSLDAQFALDSNGRYISAPANIIAVEDLYLLGILNSPITTYFIRSIAAIRGGDFLEFKPMYVGQIPIASADSETKHSISKLVRERLNCNDDARCSKIDSRVNSEVFALYRLGVKEQMEVSGQHASIPELV